MSQVPSPQKGTTRYLVVSLLAIGLQGAVLAYALMHPSDPASWIAWGAILAVAITVIAVALSRSMRIAREFRQREWGEGS